LFEKCNLVVFGRIDIADIDFLFRKFDNILQVVFFDFGSKQTG